MIEHGIDPVLRVRVEESAPGIGLAGTAKVEPGETKEGEQA
jgi:hypothetical protein